MKDKFNKSIEFKTIDEEKGQVEAVFSVYNRLDTDGDVVIPGAIKSGFKDNQVPMVFAHKWDQPIGKGTIETDDDKATFKGSFFMGTEAGKEAYNLAKEMGDLQEWSFGFRINDYEVAPFKKDGIDEEVDVRYLKDLEVFEVSPVLVGANRETYTLAIKSGEDAVYESSEEKAANDNDIFDNAEDAKKRAEELGCSGSHTHEVDGKEVHMPCATHESYEEAIKPKKDLSEDEKGKSCDYGETGKCAKEGEKSSDEDTKVSEENNSSLQGVTFSGEVKEVLAALESLIIRAKAIAILRKNDGRTLSVKASSALRAVQDDLTDAWNEIDTIIDENIEIPEAEADAEVEAAIEEVSTEEVSEEAVSEEATEEASDAEVSAEEESEEVSEEVEVEVSEEIVEDEEEAEEEIVELEEVDEEFEALFTEAQATLTEATLLELDDEEV